MSYCNHVLCFLPVEDADVAKLWKIFRRYDKEVRQREGVACCLNSEDVTLTLCVCVCAFYSPFVGCGVRSCVLIRR